MELTKKKLVVNDRTIRYLTGGKGKKLLFLHGWPVQPFSYKNSLSIIAESREVYAPFLFDFNSESFEDAAASLAAMLEQLEIKEILVAGTSFGGAVAAVLASRRPDLVSKLVLVNSAGLPRSSKAIAMFVQALKNWGMLASKRKFGIIFGIIFCGLRFSAGLHNSRRRALLRELRNKTLDKSFEEISAKTAIIWSKGDKLFPADYAYVLNKKIKDSEITLVEGIHAWPYHQPELFASLILQGTKQTF